MCIEKCMPYTSPGVHSCLSRAWSFSVRPFFRFADEGGEGKTYAVICLVTSCSQAPRAPVHPLQA